MAWPPNSVGYCTNLEKRAVELSSQDYFGAYAGPRLAIQHSMCSGTSQDEAPSQMLEIQRLFSTNTCLSVLCLS
jgi:hypothetical protein